MISVELVADHAQWPNRITFRFPELPRVGEFLKIRIDDLQLSRATLAAIRKNRNATPEFWHLTVRGVTWEPTGDRVCEPVVFLSHEEFSPEER